MYFFSLVPGFIRQLFPVPQHTAWVKGKKKKVHKDAPEMWYLFNEYSIQKT